MSVCCQPIPLRIVSSLLCLLKLCVLNHAYFQPRFNLPTISTAKFRFRKSEFSVDSRKHFVKSFVKNENNAVTEQVNSEVVRLRPPPKIPVGDTNFPSISSRNQYFVDKSPFIPAISEFPYAVYCRPPRFGKTTLLSMLQTFYDRKTSEEEFDSYFGNLAVIKELNYTFESRSYFVLRLVMAFDPTSNSEVNFNTCVNEQLMVFYQKYGIMNYRELGYIHEKSASDSLFALHRFMLSQPRESQKLMILIDEYDRLMNLFISSSGDSSQDPYQKFQSLIEKQNMIKTFYQRIKTIEDGLKSYRFFITGISPMYLNEIAGFNSFEDISMKPAFASMLGFTKKNILDGLKVLDNVSEKYHDRILEVFEEYCDGYRFLYCDEPLFNPFLSCQFLKELGNNKFFLEDVLDGAVNVDDLIDFSKVSPSVLKIVSRTSHAGIIAFHLLDPNATFKGKLQSRFALKDLLKSDEMDNEHAQDITQYNRALSFLYQQGLLTLDGYYTARSTCQGLKVSNKIVGSQSALEEFKRALAPIDQCILDFAMDPDDQTLKNILDSLFLRLDTFLDTNMGENAICILIEATFKRVLKDLMNCEVAVIEPVSESNQWKSMFIDFVIETNDKVILIAIKRIRPNALKIPGTVFDGSEEVSKRESKEEFRKIMKAFYPLHRTQELKSLTILPSQTRNYKFKPMNDCSISGIHRAAAEQLNRYARSKQIVEKRKKIYCFTAIQVGYPFVVTKVN